MPTPNDLAQALLAPPGGAPAAGPDANAQALARMLAGQQAPISIDQRVADVTGMSPTMDRSFLLPVGREAGSEKTEWAWPGAVHELAKALMLPGHAMKGGAYEPADVTNMAMDWGMLAAPVGAATMPKGALGTFGGKAAGMSDDVARKLYHVAGPDYDGGDLLPLTRRLGEAEGLDEYFKRWPQGHDSHAYRVFLYDKLDDAQGHLADFGGSKILEIDASMLDDLAEGDKWTEGFPNAGEVPAWAILREILKE